MTSPARGMLRLTRAGALALAIVALSLAAHVLGGGMAPGPVGLVVVTVPVVGLCLAVTSRRVRLPVLTGLFAATQLALHQSFDVLSAPILGSVVGMPGAHQGEHLALSTAPAMSHGGGVWMTVAHVLAAIACVLVLTRGEAAVWTLWQRLLGRVPEAVAGPHPTVSLRTDSARGVLASSVLTGPLRVRGPPRASRPA
jgi:hypothetical protein